MRRSRNKQNSNIIFSRMLNHQQIQHLMSSYAEGFGIDVHNSRLREDLSFRTEYEQLLHDGNIDFAVIPNRSNDGSIDDSLRDSLLKFVRHIDSDNSNRYNGVSSIIIGRGHLANINGQQQIVGSSHWSCLHLRYDRENNQIQAYNIDSIGSDNIPRRVPIIISQANQILSQENLPTISENVTALNCNRQTDGFSCGYHSVFNAINVLEPQVLRDLENITVDFDRFLQESQQNLQLQPSSAQDIFSSYRDKIKKSSNNSDEKKAKIVNDIIDLLSQAQGKKFDESLKLLQNITKLQRELNDDNYLQDSLRIFDQYKEILLSCIISMSDDGMPLYHSQESANADIEYIADFLTSDLAVYNVHEFIDELIAFSEKKDPQSLQILHNKLTEIENKVDNNKVKTTKSESSRQNESDNNLRSSVSTKTPTSSQAKPKTAVPPKEISQLKTSDKDKATDIKNKILNSAEPKSEDEIIKLQQEINDNVFSEFKPDLYCGLGAKAVMKYDEESKMFQFEIEEVFQGSKAQKLGLQSGDKIFVQSKEDGKDQVKAINSLRNCGLTKSDYNISVEAKKSDDNLSQKMSQTLPCYVLETKVCGFKTLQSQLKMQEKSSNSISIN